jgi:hypothetical protein
MFYFKNNSPLFWILIRLIVDDVYVWAEKDSNLRRRSQQIYSLSPLTAREPAHKDEQLTQRSTIISLEPTRGLEPRTDGLQNRSSTS